MRKATRSWFKQRERDRRRKRRTAGKSGVYPPPGTVAPDKPGDAAKPGDTDKPGNPG